MDRLRSVYLSRSEAIALSGSAFVLYAFASLAWTKADPLYSGMFLLSLIAAFALGFLTNDLRAIWQFILGFAIFILAIVMFQSFFTVGLNFLGALFAVGLAITIVESQWWFLPFAGLGLLYSESRTAQIAAGVTILVALWRWSRYTAIIASFAIIALAFTIKIDGGMSLWSRAGVWQDTINHMVPWGHGYGSFAAEYAKFPFRTNMGFEYAPAAYNDLLQLAFELGLGIVPLIFFISLILEVDSRLRLVCLTFGILSLTYFPLQVPLLGHIFTLTLGHLARERI